jgi:hypothetical protein
MSDGDERALEQLRQIFGERVRGGATAEENDAVDDEVDQAVEQRLINAEFTKRLLRYGDHKQRERQQRRDKEDRRQEGQDR